MNDKPTVWVSRVTDDRPVPATGLLVGREDEDWVWVLWGEAARDYTAFRQPGDPIPAGAVREAADELTPARVRHTVADSSSAASGQVWVVITPRFDGAALSEAWASGVADLEVLDQPPGWDLDRETDRGPGGQVCYTGRVNGGDSARWTPADSPVPPAAAYEITYRNDGELITDPYERAAADRCVQLPDDEPDPDPRVWLNDEVAYLITEALQRHELAVADIRAAFEDTLALQEPRQQPGRQPILRIGLPGIPETCGTCGLRIGDAPLELNGARLCAVCPACHAVIAPVRLVAAAGTPLTALGEPVSDRHLQDVHGPIITRSDLETAEADHRDLCGGDGS
jgi:hypothetical protein